tara:strand:+ start:977 stop:1165 length:189 start_codon:yes stop_codon:yes gene_type:complete
MRGEKMSPDESIAYKVGFFDGYKYGTEKNPYHHLKESDKHKYYRYGYDKGVSEYCEQEITGE